MPKTHKEIKSGNYQLLENIGNVNKPNDFARIRSFGDKNSAETHDGVKVQRQNYIQVQGYGEVRTCPYELHFIYEDKSGKLGRWSPMCTCGSIAGVVSYKDVKDLMSPTLGENIVCCIAHTASKQNTGIGTHADGSHE